MYSYIYSLFCWLQIHIYMKCMTIKYLVLTHQDPCVVWFAAGDMMWRMFVVSAQQKYPVKELTTDGIEVIWDSKKGFILPSHEVSYAGVVYCQTIIRNETYQSSPYIMAVVGKQKKKKKFIWAGECCLKYSMRLVHLTYHLFQFCKHVRNWSNFCFCGGEIACFRIICWDCWTVWCEISCPGLKRTMLHPARPLHPFLLPQDTRSMTSPWVQLMRGWR